MDDTTRRVQEMYAKFPYPSPRARGRKLKELANLLSIFSLETRYNFEGKTVLDVGTGTGHRLIEAASLLQSTQFVAVDLSEVSLDIARQAAAERNIRNVHFQLFNVMEDGSKLGTFDVILCMGVLHHLSDPVRGLCNIVSHLADDGILFLYLYGRQGGQERMRRKQIVSLLLGDKEPKDFELGIRLVKDLGFDSFEYGWNLNFGDQESVNALIVDSYLNVNEALFDVDTLLDLLQPSGLHGFMVYGLTLDQHGLLFETRLRQESLDMPPQTEMSDHLKTPLLQEIYEMLGLREKYRLIDFLYQPNGYTLIAFKLGALACLSNAGRIRANTVVLSGSKR